MVAMSGASASANVNGRPYEIVDHSFDVVVVGAGPGGMAAAIAAEAGRRVCLLDDNAGPGGSNSDFEPGKFSRDRGKARMVCQR